MASIASWIYDKPLRGNYTFTHDEVAQAFPEMSAGSIARALTREVSKGRIEWLGLLEWLDIISRKKEHELP